MPIKLLFDMEQLSIAGTKGTGVVRIAKELLFKLANNPDIDLYPLVTTKRGDVIKYLEYANLTNLKDKIVYMTKLKNTTKSTSIKKRIKSKISSFINFNKYNKQLSNFDAYFSISSPISPIVYKSNIKTYMFIHDLIPIFHPEFCDAKFVTKYTSRMKDIDADTIFCNSEYTKQDLLKFRPDLISKNIDVAYLAADEKFQPITDVKTLKNVKEKYNIKTDKYFLGVSELSTRKNFIHLLQSYINFLRKTKAEDISLVLVGPIRKGFKDITKAINNFEEYKEKIICTGFADDQDMAPLYSGALAFCYPSLYEGFGLPILEAMQCETPVISADNSSLPEVGGDAVIYITGKDEEETSTKLTEIYTNKNLRENLSKKSQTQSQNFSWDKFNNQICNVMIKEIKK